MSSVLASSLLSREELIAYYVTIWNEVLAPVCGAQADPQDVVHDFAASHVKDAYAATQWRFKGDMGFGGKLITRSDMSCRVSCDPEDTMPARREAADKANLLLKNLHRRFFEGRMDESQFLPF